jgi:hypothetical protein
VRKVANRRELLDTCVVVVVPITSDRAARLVTAFAPLKYPMPALINDEEDTVAVVKPTQKVVFASLILEKSEDSIMPPCVEDPIIVGGAGGVPGAVLFPGAAVAFVPDEPVDVDALVPAEGELLVPVLVLELVLELGASPAGAGDEAELEDEDEVTTEHTAQFAIEDEPTTFDDIEYGQEMQLEEFDLYKHDVS